MAEKAISSAGTPVSPSEALRLVFECLSGGLLLTPFGHGMLDPCEKDCVDAIGYLSRQEKTDITQYAQVLLTRLGHVKIKLNRLLCPLCVVCFASSNLSSSTQSAGH